MFKTELIRAEGNGLVCSVLCQSRGAAEKIRAGYTGPVRQINLFSDLYCQGKELFVEAPDRDTLLKLIDILNNSVEWEF